MRNYSSYFIFICLFFRCSLSSTLIDQSCADASSGDPNLSYDFCVKALESDPKSKSAKTLADLTSVAVELTASNATSIGSRITELLGNKNLDPYTKSALEDCLELYSDAKSTLDDVKQDLEAKDFYKANSDLSAVLDASTTCEDGFNEGKSGSSPLTKENNDFFQITVIGLAFTNKLIGS